MICLGFYNTKDEFWMAKNDVRSTVNVAILKLGILFDWCFKKVEIALYAYFFCSFVCVMCFNKIRLLR